MTILNSGRGTSDWARWVKIPDIAARYEIPVKKVRNRLVSGTWPCHRHSGMVRFSPRDQLIIEQKWQQFRGDDPPNRALSEIELLLQGTTKQQAEGMSQGPTQYPDRGRKETSMTTITQEVDEQWLTCSYKRAADLTGCSTSTIRRAVATGHLVSFPLAGTSKPVIPRESLEAWIRESATTEGYYRGT